MKKVWVGIVLLALAGCVEVNETSVTQMPTGYLCSFLDPNTWTTTARERQAIFQELKRRNADCILPSGAAKKNF